MVTAPSAGSIMVITAALHSALHQDRNLRLVAVDTARAVTCIAVSDVNTSIRGAVSISTPLQFSNLLNSRNYEYKVFFIAPHGHVDLDVEHSRKDPQLFLSTDKCSSFYRSNSHSQSGNVC